MKGVRKKVWGCESDEAVIRRAKKGFGKTQVWLCEIYVPQCRFSRHKKRLVINPSEIRHVIDEFQKTLEKLGCVVRMYLDVG